MEITRETLEQFRTDLSAALTNLENKYGVKIIPGGIRYSDVDFTVSLKVEKGDAETIKLNRVFQEFPWFRNWYGKQFVDGRHTYKIVGYEAGKKFNIVCERDDTKIYKYTHTFVQTKI